MKKHYFKVLRLKTHITNFVTKIKNFVLAYANNERLHTQAVAHYGAESFFKKMKEVVQHEFFSVRRSSVSLARVSPLRGRTEKIMSANNERWKQIVLNPLSAAR